MTDQSLHIEINHAGRVTVLDLWDETCPDLKGMNAIQVEPRRWWLLDADSKSETRLAETLDQHGTLTPIGGGLMRAIFSGIGWREALMYGGWFDAEDSDFKAGAVAATVLHHIPVWLHVVAEDTCHVYFAASYAESFSHHWHAN